MALRALVAPLVSGSTYRRGVHLLLGAVLLLPYILVGAAFVQVLTSDRPRFVTLLLLGLTVVIAVPPAFLRATRDLETVAARGLLDVELPDQTARHPAPEARLRSALWFAIHLVAGGVLASALLFALPMALALIGPFDPGPLVPEGFRLGPLDERDTIWLSLIGVGLLVALVYAVAGLGRLATMMAPVLLGPSPDERIAALEAQTAQLAERNRLARELHDSIGHALTVTTLQAGGARKVLDTDPEFVRQALEAVEETGRQAMADLDYVLGLLRDGDPTGGTPPRSLAHLDELLTAARNAGAEIAADLTGQSDRLPAPASREVYRVVQESLTNAAKHAGGEPVSLRVAVADDAVTVEVTNPVRADPSAPRGGRGLTGMRERAELLGGCMRAGQASTDADRVWRVVVRIPLGGRRAQGRQPKGST